MNSILAHTKRAAALAAVVFALTGAVGTAGEVVPLVVMDKVPLPDAIRNLAHAARH